MKKTLRYLALLVVSAFLIAGCGGGSDPVITALLKGLVVDGNGAPVDGATITVGTATATSKADGTYELAVTPGANLKVSASKTGLVTSFDIIDAAANQTVPVDFALRAVDTTTALTGMATAQKVATDSRGASVTLPAGSIVDANGAVVDAASVAVTTTLPGDRNFTDAFPGLFIGNLGGVNTPIESFGFVTIDITCGGQPCNLGAGKTAEIAIPVSNRADPGTATIDIWSQDEATGIWVHEGQATRDASGVPVVYRATVSHFSTYNLDRPLASPIPFNVTVKNAAGTGVAGAQVTFISEGSEGGVWEGRGVTGADGLARFAQVPPGRIQVKAVAGSQIGNAYSYSLDNGEGVIEITLYEAVTKSYTLVYLVNGVETPAANVVAVIFSEGPQGGGGESSGITNANGVATFNVQSGAGFYGYSAYNTVDGVTYSVFGHADSLDAIPAKWELTLTPYPGEMETPQF